MDLALYILRQRKFHPLRPLSCRLCFSPLTRQDATKNRRNKRFLAYSKEEGCQVRKDQEEQGQCQVQGALQPVPVHPRHHRQGEGREAETVPAPRSGCEGAQVEDYLRVQ